MRRSAPLHRGRPPQRRTPMPAYRPPAHWRKVRGDVLSRANGQCEARIEGVCTVRAITGHHLLLRSQGGKDDGGNLLAVCGECHRYIHTHVAWAVQRGFIWQARAFN